MMAPDSYNRNVQHHDLHLTSQQTHLQSEGTQQLRAAYTSKADLDLWCAPTPCEGVQQSNAAEKHVLPAVTAAKGGQVAVIRQGQGGVAIARTGGLPLHL